jgi:hypothetical protein
VASKTGGECLSGGTAEYAIRRSAPVRASAR